MSETETRGASETGTQLPGMHCEWAMDSNENIQYYLVDVHVDKVSFEYNYIPMYMWEYMYMYMYIGRH